MRITHSHRTLILPLAASLMMVCCVAGAESAPRPTCACNDDCSGSYGGDICTDGYCYHGDPKTEGTPCAPCSVPMSNCGGACYDFDTDRRHCGGCGQRCSEVEECVAGKCDCTEGTVCGGRCVNANYDSANCGQCGTQCAGLEQCIMGSCVCGAFNKVCSGACVNPFSDPDHCGACGNSCQTNEHCTNSTCMPGQARDGGPSPTKLNDAGPPTGEAQAIRDGGGCSLSTPPLGVGLSALLLLLWLVGRRADD